MGIRWPLLAVLVTLLPAPTPVDAAGRSETALRLGPAIQPLIGPWRFRTGDNPSWKDPTFDDADWQTVDLAAEPGSHDPDVGLPDYVAGWMARGHPTHAGYAWYRIHVAWEGPLAADLVLLGPTLVDDAYQVYWNGQLLGGSGDWGDPPRVYGTKPALFRLPAGPETPEAVIAVRVYMLPGEERLPDSGGLHVAPAVATREAGEDRHRVQWQRMIAGYVVDLIEPLLFVLTAAFGAFLARLAPARARGVLLLASAAVLTALLRVGQVIFYWTDLLDLRTFLQLRGLLLEPLGLLAWALAWNRWLLPPDRRVDRAAGALAGVCAAGWLLASSSNLLLHAGRWGFMLLFVWLALRILRGGEHRVVALASLLLIATGQFAPELSGLGVPGIWFPFGVGVSRTQFAYALAIPLLVVLLGRVAPGGSPAWQPAPSPSPA
jgi:hypothetical protein